MLQPPEAYKDMLETYYKYTVPVIYPGKLLEMIESGEQYLLLDTREKEEFQVSRIHNATLVGYQDFSLKSANKEAKNIPVIVYCSIGARSEEIGEKLLDAGFKKVYNLYGGIFYWVNMGYPILDSRGDTTHDIHPYNEEWGKWLNKGNKVYE